jgi:hypothetical protein
MMACEVQVIRLLVTAALLAVSRPGSALAQDLQLGLKAGFTRADLLEIPSEDWHSRTSLAGGALVATRVTRWLGIRSEVLLMPKNVFKSEVLDGPDGPMDRRFDRKPLYLEIPVLAQLTLPGLPSPLPSLLLGLAGSFELSCTETFSFRRLSDGVKLVEQDGECDRRLTAPESPEIGGVVGLLAQLPVGGLTLGLEARYTRGLYDLGNSRFPEERNFPEHRTAALSVLLEVMRE